MAVTRGVRWVLDANTPGRSNLHQVRSGPNRTHTDIENAFAVQRWLKIVQNRRHAETKTNPVGTFADDFGVIKKFLNNFNGHSWKWERLKLSWITCWVNDEPSFARLQSAGIDAL